MNRLGTDSVDRLTSESHERDEQYERTDVEVSSVAEKSSLPVTRGSGKAISGSGWGK